MQLSKHKRRPKRFHVSPVASFWKAKYRAGISYAKIFHSETLSRWVIDNSLSDLRPTVMGGRSAARYGLSEKKRPRVKQIITHLSVARAVYRTRDRAAPPLQDSSNRGG